MPTREPTTDDAVALLERLVAFETVSDRTNLPLIEWVRDYLGQHGIESTILPTAEGDKAALFATIGPRDRPGLCLSGHTDVVPVVDQPWTSDPFTLIERDNRLYGRGTTDMKGFSACVLSMIPRFAASKLTTPIHFVLSYDEEIGCLGILPTIDRLGIDLPKPLAVFVGEPTEMTVVDAHKSINGFITEVTGHEAHSSKPDLGANAILAAAEIVGEIDRTAADMRERGDPSGRFDPPFTTVHVGTITGGTQLNIVPRHCRMHWEFRGLPDIDEAEIPARIDRYAQTEVLPKLTAAYPQSKITTEMRDRVPGLAPEPGSLAERLALRFAKANRTFAVPFGTEAGHFQAVGIPTVVCGPGSINQAHAPDEFVTREQLARCQDFLARLGEACVEGI
ncbi:MAG: acetylornithine deacetylase [Hyphomicrobiales bacterium]|nr:acetylornithine deacetylase [Hyphomicrobiales bacterium]